MKAQLLAFLNGIPLKTKLAVSGIVFLAALVGGGLAVYGAKQRSIGALNAQISQQEHDNRMLRMAQDSLAGVYRVDTVRFTRLKTKWDTTYQRLTDTLKLTDTVKVEVKVLVQADSTIKACTQALSTCEARVGVAEKGWANARAEIAKIKASYPSKSQKWIYGLAGIGSGYVLGRVMR